MTNTDSGLTRGAMIAFVAPKLAFGLVSAPFFFVLPAFYAEHTNTTLTELGSILVLTRVLDAVLDPLIGVLTDRTRSRWGARKPWYLAGAVLMAGAIFFLFNPPSTAGGTYFLVWAVAFFAGWSMFDIPGDAWLTEISGDYRTRARIVGWQSMAKDAGGLIFFLASITGLVGKGMSPALFSLMGWIAMVLLPSFALGAVLIAPAGRAVARDRPKWTDLWAEIPANGPLRIYLLTQVLGGIGGGVYLSCQMFLLTAYFRQGENFGLIFLVNQLAAFVAFPLWLQIVYRIGKHRAWAWSWVLSALSLPLALLVPPGPSALIWLCILAGGRNILAGADMIAPRSLMADAIDYGSLKSGRNAAGSAFALATIVIKFTAAAANGLGFWLLAAVGFAPKAGPANSPEAIHGLLWIALGLPILLKLAAGLVIQAFPIDERRAIMIRRRLERRAGALEKDPATPAATPVLAK